VRGIAPAPPTARSRLSGATGTSPSSGSRPRTAASATDWVWARAQPSAFALLVTDRGWPATDHVDRAVPSILAEVVSPGS
jgi:hypothetical protein